MSQYVIRLQLQPFIAAWLRSHYGDPVTFPARSAERLAVRRLTVSRRSDAERLYGERQLESGMTTVEVSVPDCSYKRASTFHYLSRRGRRRLTQMVDDLFQADLFGQLTSRTARGSLLKDAVWDWCMASGIAPDHTDTIRQRFYRMRESHKQCGLATSPVSTAKR